MEKEQKSRAVPISFRFTTKDAIVVGILVIAFVAAFMMRSLPLQYGFYLNEFDPYFDYRATQFLVENGIEEYFAWHDNMSWYPEGRDVAKTSQTGLHLSAAALYAAFGGGAPLYDFVVWLPVVLGSLTAIVLFAVVRVISNTTAGLFASLFFALSPAIIQRGNLGWFKSEPLGLFLGLIATYLLLSALKHKEIHFGAAKAAGAGLVLGFAMTAWGGIQYFPLVWGLFFLALPFFTKETRNMLIIVPIFTALTVATASAFPRPGETFAVSLAGLALIGPTIYLVAAHFVVHFAPAKRLRNLSAWLGAFMAGAVTLLAAGSYITPSSRYVSAVIPFAKSEIPLVESVAEHFTPTVVDYFINYAPLIPLAGYGMFLCFRKRSSMAIFALILGITGIYVSASFSRLMVYSSIAMITLASIALYEITTSIFTRSEPAAAQTKKEKVKLQTSHKDFRIAYTVLIIAMLTTPLFLPQDAGWIASADLPIAITNGASTFRTSTTDWIDAMEWIKNNTEPDAVIASWWDYGYWITTLGNRASLADNATINQTRIQQIAKAFVSDEASGLQIMNDLQADYVLVYVVGQRVSSAQGTTFVALGGGGEESKKHWFMRIAEVDEHLYLEDDGYTPKPVFWSDTLLGKMIPFKPAGYVRLDQFGRTVDLQAEYRPGYSPLYLENVNYASLNGPLTLVYASPSFTNKNSGVMLGVLLYKVTGLAPVSPEEETNQNLIGRLEPGKEYGVLEMAIGGQPMGQIVMELFRGVAPGTVTNFESLADAGFYDGIKIHRIVPDFVIQGGDPNTRSEPRETWGQGGPGYTINAEISNMTHSRGIVSMARLPDDINSASSQFFIVVKDAPQLDGQYTIFGRVVEGMELVDSLTQVPRDERDIPAIDVTITKAYILRT